MRKNNLTQNVKIQCCRYSNNQQGSVVRKVDRPMHWIVILLKPIFELKSFFTSGEFNIPGFMAFLPFCGSCKNH